VHCPASETRTPQVLAIPDFQRAARDDARIALRSPRACPVCDEHQGDAIPDAALPRLPAAGLAEAPARDDSPVSEGCGMSAIVTARDDSALGPAFIAKRLTDFGGRSRDRTCDFVRVKDALYR
jgi:hypothetical protein